MQLLRRHKISTAVGGLGALVVLSHLLLGPDVVPVAAVLSGLALAGGAALRLAIARRRRAMRVER
jgi:hypothetical protein